MRYVYVVCEGEAGEGHSPVRVFASPYSAMDYVAKAWGVQIALTGDGRWKGVKPQSNGVDEVWIYQMAVA